MRNFIDIIESVDPIIEKILPAVLAWGETTHGNYQGKVDALLAIKDECQRFTRPTKWLYRGAGCKSAQMKMLRAGKTIALDDRPMLSWTTSFKVAQEFAEGTLESEMLLIEKQGLEPFFDYVVFAKYLKSVGYDYTNDERLTDPIREKEVIVWTPSALMITRDDINDAYL
jgi:hypothetical protein